MNIFIILLLIGGFNLKWVIPEGDGAYGRVLVGDLNHNALPDLVIKRFLRNKIVMFYEFDNSEFILRDSLSGNGDDLPWSIGDFDNDGLYDMVTATTFSYPPPVPGISIYESPDSFSYPTNEVWRDTVDFGVVIPHSVYDVDKDSFMEVFYPVGEPGSTSGYWKIWAMTESDRNDSYIKRLFLFEDNIMSIASTFAFGDFDLDGLNEFVYGDIDGYYSIFECIGDNSYQRVKVAQLPTANIKDCFSVKDMDGDGKMEFIVKGFIYPYNQYNVFIFEAVSDNQYQIKKQLNYQGPGNDNIQSYSCAGDVDSDYVEEAILLTQPWIRILKASGDDNFYVWDSIYVGPYGGSVAVYDIDGNGIKEIIWSGNDVTKIYEWDGTDIRESSKVKSQKLKIGIPTIVGAASIPRDYKIFTVAGRTIATRKSLLQGGLKKGIYFIKFKEKTFKIIKLK